MSRMDDRGKPNAQVYVGDLKPGTSENDLEASFNRFGTIRHVWVARNPPGFGFVDFEDYRDADDAIRALDGTRINGSSVRVELSKGVRKRGGRSGGGFGDRDRGGFERRNDRPRYDRRDDREYDRSDRYERNRSAEPAPRRRRSRSRSASPYH